MILIATHLALWVVAAVIAVVACVLVRHVAELRTIAADAQSASTQSQNLALGSAVPEFSAVDSRSGSRIQAADLRGRRSVLLFVSSGCRSCVELVNELAEFDLRDYPDLFLHCQGSTCAEEVGRLEGAVRVLHEESVKLPGLLHVTGTPFAILINERGSIDGYRLPTTAQDVLQSLQPTEDRPQARRQVA